MEKQDGLAWIPWDEDRITFFFRHQRVLFSDNEQGMLNDLQNAYTPWNWEQKPLKIGHL